MGTEFYLATKPQEYKACHEILDKLGRKAAFPLSFPTVIGKRNGKIIGFISTRPPKTQKAVVLGEMAIDPSVPHSIHVIVPMIEIYEGILLNAKVTSYLACVPKENKDFIEIIERASGVVPYAHDDTSVWINRRIA